MTNAPAPGQRAPSDHESSDPLLSELVPGATAPSDNRSEGTPAQPPMPAEPPAPPEPPAPDQPPARQPLPQLTERDMAARARGLDAPFIPGGDDPDLDEARRREAPYVRLLIGMVALIVLATLVVTVVGMVTVPIAR